MAEKKEGKNKSSWSQTALRTIADGLGVDIKITAKTNPRDIWNSRERVVYRLTLPNQHKVDVYNFKENIWNDVNQYLIISQAVGNHIDFDEWFKQWRFNFPSLILRPHKKSDIKTNYPIRTESNLLENGVGVDELPEYILYKAPKINLSYMTIEYFPEGTSNPELSFIYSGTVSSIISNIVSYHSQPQSQADYDSDIETERVSGHPKVVLYFQGKKRLPGQTRPTRVQIGFRLMNKVEHQSLSYQGETVLTNEDTKILSNKIKNIFAGKIFRRGPICYTYVIKPMGYIFKYFGEDKESAISMFSSLLSIQNHTLDERRITENIKPWRQSNTPAKTIKVLDSDVTISPGVQPQDLVITGANLILGHSRKSKILYDANKVEF